MNPVKIPELFNLSLESELFSSILEILEGYFMKNGDNVITYLEGFTKVERFMALVLFLTDKDKRSKLFFLFILNMHYIMKYFFFCFSSKHSPRI